MLCAVFSWRAFSSSDGPPGAYLTVPSLERAGIEVAFTARAGGISESPFAGLNLSFVSGDDPDRVRRNRARALAAVGADLSEWTSARQVHGAHVLRATDTDRGRGAADPSSVIGEADALWTDQPRVALAVLVADCVPIVLADPARRRIGVVHAGWRGLVSGVVENAAEAMGGAAEAFVGPSIGPCCYQVGDDVSEPARRAFGDDVLAGDRLDLWHAARIALARAGVTRSTVAAVCTRCEPHRFYSHRAGDAARQAAIARLR